ncbi:MAG: GumC family protein [Bryobacteraceae bacterium]
MDTNIDPSRALLRSQSLYPVPNDHPEFSLSFSVREAAGVLRRRKVLILWSIVSMLALGVAVAMLITPKYQSTSILEINKESADMLGLDNGAAASSAPGSDALEFNITMGTHEKALQTDTLALQVIQQLRLDTRPEFAWKPSRFDSDQVKAEIHAPVESAPHKRESLLKAFHRRLKVKAVTGTRLLEVRFKDPDPQLAAEVVNHLTSDYLEQYFRTRSTATAQVSDWLSKQLDQLKAQVAASDQKLVDYQKEAGILGTDGAANVVMSKLDDLNKKLTEAEDNRITRQAIYKLVRSGNAELVSGLAGSSFSGQGFAGQNPLENLQHLRAQEQDLKVQYAEAAKKFGPAYPKLVQMNSQLDTLDAAIENETRKIGKRAENDYLAAQNAERMLQSSFEHQKAEANKLNSKAIQFSILKREAESSRQIYDDLQMKLKSAGVLSGLRSTNMLVLDPARPSTDPVRPRSIIIGFGLLAGLLVGVVLAFGKEALDRTIRNPDQAHAVTLLPQLGLIPDLRSVPLSRAARRVIANSSKPIALTASDSSIAEAYRQLRTCICMSMPEAPKVIMVTSPMMHDGKTTTAINLATVLAQQGARVLLVDADLRRPSIHARLKLQSSSGFAILEDGKNRGFDFIAACDCLIVEYPEQPNLFLFPGGKKVVRTAELLGSKQMRRLLHTWRSDFDFVVLDSSPVLSATDAVVLSTNVDAVLLVARSEATPKDALIRTRDLLLRANANIVGVLVNAVNLSSSDYQEYYGNNFSSTEVESA